jgi:hypothetical protein
MPNTKGVTVSLPVHQLLHFSATTVATISIVLDDSPHELSTAQLEDELLFQRGKRCHGTRSVNKGE